MTETTDAQSVSAAFDTLDNAHSALHALGVLVSLSIRTGDDFHHIADGLAVLFGSHIANAQEAMETLHANPDFRTLAMNNFDVIASNREAARAALALQVDKEALRREVLAEKLQDGIDTTGIAKAANLEREAVERVIAQLLASAPIAAQASALGRTASARK